MTAMAAQESVSITLGKVLDQSGYLQDLREERSEEAEGRIENLAELVSAAREYETRDPEPSLGGFVDQLSLLSDVDEESGTRDARVLMMTMHSAKGLEFPVVVIAGLEEGLFPHSRSADDEAELEEERRLCYVGITRARAAARADVGRPAPRVRRLPVDGAVTFPRRDPAGTDRGSAVDLRRRTIVMSGVPRAVVRQGQWISRARRAKSSRSTRTRTRISRFRPASSPDFASATPSSASGTIVSVEPLDDDVKLIVRFNSVGQKTLRAKFAKLEVA